MYQLWDFCGKYLFLKRFTMPFLLFVNDPSILNKSGSLHFLLSWLFLFRILFIVDHVCLILFLYLSTLIKIMRLRQACHDLLVHACAEIALSLQFETNTRLQLDICKLAPGRYEGVAASLCELAKKACEITIARTDRKLALAHRKLIHASASLPRSATLR